MYWKIASLVIFAIFCGWSFIEVKIKMRKEQNAEDSFWEREAKANAVRRKPIDHLNYIKISDNLPYGVLQDNEEIINIMNVLNRLKKERILNLTGYSNTDLKLEYGAPNITELTRYDQNYTALVTSLQKWSDILLDNGYDKEAYDIMEYLVDIGADIGKTYRLLGTRYKDTDPGKIDYLISKAEELRSLNKPYIVQFLKDLKT